MSNFTIPNILINLQHEDYLLRCNGHDLNLRTSARLLSRLIYIYLEHRDLDFDSLIRELKYTGFTPCPTDIALKELTDTIFKSIISKLYSALDTTDIDFLEKNLLIGWVINGGVLFLITCDVRESNKHLEEVWDIELPRRN